ncbi:hypothetical protein CEXT_180531 [Caerostris extrusa]|uniref:Uncharacterized protein n=1 Tax=Caerostris extrusa TaxID=172846 RepID=A0AAV4TMA5_CAEEX|nr:hypothetical protein CEXT_180531 [Caerostris extrusa]
MEYKKKRVIKLFQEWKRNIGGSLSELVEGTTRIRNDSSELFKLCGGFKVEKLLCGLIVNGKIPCKKDLMSLARMGMIVFPLGLKRRKKVHTSQRPFQNELGRTDCFKEVQT